MVDTVQPARDQPRDDLDQQGRLARSAPACETDDAHGRIYSASPQPVQRCASSRVDFPDCGGRGTASGQRLRYPVSNSQTGSGRIMKKLLLASSALVFAGSAFAADMPVTKAPLPVAVPFTWNGCYAGAHAGYGWGEKGFSDPGLGAGFAIAPLGATAEVDTQGWLAGGQIGCNMQGGNWVLGFEADVRLGQHRRVRPRPVFCQQESATPSSSAPRRAALGSVTGRVGYAFDRFLVYGKGGAAWAHDQYNASLFFLALRRRHQFHRHRDRVGWTVGAGVEYAFWDEMVGEGRIQSLRIRRPRGSICLTRPDLRSCRPTSTNASIPSRSASTTASGRSDLVARLGHVSASSRPTCCPSRCGGFTILDFADEPRNRARSAAADASRIRLPRSPCRKA